MRHEVESREPVTLNRTWIVVLACIGMVALAPTAALAEPPPGDTAIDDSDEAEGAAPLTQADLDEAQKSIDEAQRQLDNAKKHMPAQDETAIDDADEAEETEPPAADVGPGLVHENGRATKLQVSLNKDGSLYFRFAAWLQVWTRAMQLNPGTQVLGKDESWYGDVGIRRARFLMFGKIAPRTFLLMHIGINNQTFRNARKPQVYFHDAWVEFEAEKKGHLSIGGGLIYWNGISRITNASTITFMSLDAPIVNWPTIERADQFARQLGLYAKGKAGLFDYRVAVTRPFTTYDPATADPTTGAGIYNTAANTWAYAGYFQFQFKDIEANTLPYTVGTYIGAKKVLNWGFGGYAQPIGTVYLADPADPTSIRKRAQFVASTDLFLDIPFALEKGGAATWYAVYYYQDFGPNNIRPVGIMNPADAGTGLNGGGNAYTLLGTGNTGYSEFGILIPGTVGKSIQFQPYVNTQLSKWDYYDQIMAHFGLGVNMFIERHNAKVTLEYRNRPIFNPDGTFESRKGNSFVLQMQLFI
jgi:hypothetical protein